MIKPAALIGSYFTLEKFKNFFWGFGVYPIVALLGVLAAWKLTNIPTRKELAVFIIISVVIPTLINPRIALYFILIISSFIPFLRRVYYVISGRPDIDFLMLITDGAIVAMLIALLMYWIKNKIRWKDKLSLIVFLFILLMISKIFILNTGKTINSLFAFKFYGLYIFLYFAGTTLIKNKLEIKKILFLYSIILAFTALYSIKQILFGYFDFENKWVESIEFTTLAIEGKIRTYSTFISPASLSDAMCVLYIFGGFFLLHKLPKLKLYGIFFMVVSIPPLLLATVRTNWIALIFGTWILFVLFRKTNKIIKAANFLAIPVLLFFMLTAETNSESNKVYIQNKTSNNLTDVMITNRTDALLNPFQESSFQKRLGTWITVIQSTYYKHPLGKGLGTTSYAHSFYIQVLGEMGYPGIILFIIILYLIVSHGLVLIYKSKHQDIKILASVFLSAIAMISLLNITGTHLNSHPSDIIFWLSAGIISKLYVEHQQESKKDLENGS